MMRRKILIWVAAIFAMAGCEKIEEGCVVDWNPVEVILNVTDGNGTDLLDPDNPNNMIVGSTITFKGQTYEAVWEREGLMYPEPRTKAYRAHLYGLYLTKRSTSPEGYSLVFGEIDGAADMDEDLVVTLPDGTTGTIHYHCSDHNERKVSCDRSWKFNGAGHEGNIFTFVVSK